jgi:hypothetical protein
MSTEDLNSLLEIAPKITERLSDQNYKGSESVVGFNVSTWSIVTMNRNNFPMPGNKVVFFGGCKTEKDVRQRILSECNELKGKA